jgi:DNA-binding CsgD family transcriptional regulator
MKRGRAVQEKAFDDVVTCIYDAAVDLASWDDALVAVATLLSSSQCALQIYHTHGFGMGSAPLMDPEFLGAYRSHWRDECPVRRASMRQPAGKVYDLDDVVGRNEFRRTPIYNEWWRAQGLGFGALGINLTVDGPNLAIASIYKPSGKEYSAVERRIFGQLMGHVIRATKINRRMRLATLTYAGPTSSAAPPNVLVVDRRGSVLLGDETSCRRLSSAGLLAREGAGHRLWTPNGALERIIEGAAKRRGGGCKLRARDGSELDVDVIPVPESGGGDFPWLAVDRPAALIHIASPGDADAERRKRLTEIHGLTPAEAAVAVEIARGDGRAAAAGRLRLRETTVRSHLTAIFDKLGIHRQAELARLVAGA